MSILKKGVCELCYQYHECRWGDCCDREWVRGDVRCPLDHFETLRMYREGLEFYDQSLRDLFGVVFGWRRIDDDIPGWCEFTDFHRY
jgi:hypothetical protein